MLCDLRIRDLLLIDKLEIAFGEGFNAMTGETGAGKSVVIGALNLVLGGRANPDCIRPGREEAEVEALFDVSDCPRLLEYLDHAGIRSGSDLVVRRVVQRTGRSRAHLNGRLTTASELASLSPDLADIASQHESVSLTDPATHMFFLDAFGGLGDVRISLASQVERLRATNTRLANLRERARDRAERDAFLRFQLAAIEDVSPRVGEMDALKAERVRLRSMAKLMHAARSAAHRLCEGDPSIYDELAKLVAELTAASSIDETLAPTVASLQAACDGVSECGRDLARYSQRLQDDPARLDQIEERLFSLERLLRLHGPGEQELVDARDRLAAEISELERVDGDIHMVEEEFAAELQKAGHVAGELSESRKRIASRLGDAISGELSALGMGGARVLVDVAPLDGATDCLAVCGARLSRDGIDRVEFLIAPNKGIPPKPLRRIASGGELSRSLLALKRVLSSSGPAGLYVFDEVDSGVGGAVAERIGRALFDISRHRQVLCITHLAPIAAFAEAHFVVQKLQDGAVATSDVRRVTGKERVQEIARMLSGSKISSASMRAATEMIRTAATL